MDDRCRRFAFLFGGLMLLIQPVRTEAQPAIPEPEHPFDTAVELYRQTSYDEALGLMYQLENDYRERENWKMLLQTLWYEGQIFHEQRKFEKTAILARKMHEIAVTHLEEDHPYHSIIYSFNAMDSAVQMKLDQALNWARMGVDRMRQVSGEHLNQFRSWFVLGYVQDARGEYSKAIENYRKAREIADGIPWERTRLHAISLSNNHLGVTWRKYGRPDRAMHFYKQNEHHLQRLYSKDHPNIALNYNNMGAVYFNSGDFALATEYFIRAANIFETTYGRRHRKVAAAYNNAGIALLKMDRTEEAFQYLLEAQEIRENVFDPGHPDLAVGYSNIASLYRERGEYELAVAFFNRSLSVRTDCYGENHPSLMKPYLNRGMTFSRMGRPKRAQEDFETVIEIAKGQPEKHHPLVAQAYLQSGKTKERSGDYAVALERYQLAIQVLSTERNLDVLDESLQETFHHPILLIESIEAKANLMNKLYRVDPVRHLLDEAFKGYKQALELIARIQLQYRYEASKLNLIGKNRTVFQGGYHTAFNLFEATGDSLFLEAALQFSESGKANIASEYLQQMNTRKNAGIPGDMTEMEIEQARTSLRLYKQLLLETDKGEHASKEVVRTIQNDLFEIHEEQHQFAEELKRKFPGYYRRKVDLQSPALNNIQSRLLKTGQAALNYVVDGDFLFIMMISSTEVHVEKVELTEDLSHSISRLARSMKENASDSFLNESFHLYKVLIQPIRERLSSYSQLLILSAPVLQHLPFELLVSGRNRERVYDQEYLIHDFSISYVPSFTLLDQMWQTEAPASQKLLAVAPLTGKRFRSKDSSVYSENVPPLPLSRYEVEQIAHRFQSPDTIWDFFTKGRNVTVLMDKQATADKVRSLELNQFGYIHFATHAYLHKKNPELSGILMAGQNSESMIHMIDIYNMNLNADLVVLSACKTGVSSIAEGYGDGITGFARAFIYSGARNLLVSKWEIDDRTTAELMILFYQELVKGAEKVEALRSAKLHMIRNPETSFPSNWASFVLIGQ